MPVVRHVASVSGEQEIPAQQLADMHAVTLATVERILAGRQVLASSRRSLDLGVEAARICLEGVCAPEDVGATIWFGLGGPRDNRPGMYLQDQLGLTNAYPIDLAFNCSETITALSVARALINDNPSLDNVLIVAGAVWAIPFPLRSPTRLRENGFGILYSDGGMAFLVQRDGPGAELVSFGNGSVGSLWDHLHRMIEPKNPDDPRGPLPTMLQALLYAKPAHDRALAQCLKTAGIGPSEVDYIVFSREPGSIEPQLLRQLGLDGKKLWDPPGGPTHTGVTDHGIGLHSLLKEAAPGSRILLAARTMGLMRCALLRMKS